MTITAEQEAAPMMRKLPDLSLPIPTAPDARRQSEGVHQDRLNEKRKHALGLIRKAIQDGAFEVCILSPLPPGLKDELTEKGYQISKPFESDYAEHSVKVSW